MATHTTAVIIKAGYPVAFVKTDGKNGDMVNYGFNLIDENIDANRTKNLVTVDRGKISRAKKYLEADLELDYGFCEGINATLESNK